jgi:long-chain fatty acid transport protein
VGATWASKVSSGKFKKYSGLFAEGGGFDTPANFGAGVAYKASHALTVSADVQQIQYSGVKSVGNPLANLFAGNLLGSANGPGFGWKDATVVKVGGTYDLNPALTLRAGYDHSSQPIPADQTFLNILAPGTVQDHLSIGATWKTKGGELSAAFTKGLKKTVNGANSIPASYGGGNANIYLEENILGVAYSWKL